MHKKHTPLLVNIKFYTNCNDLNAMSDTIGHVFKTSVEFTRERDL